MTVATPKPLTIPARGLITAPRMPERPKQHTGHPFTSLGDVVLDCLVPGCSWHAMGSRADTHKAWQEHNRLCHSEETGVVLLNGPRQ